MRIKRGRNYKRIVKFFRLHFDFQEPFNVLVDGNFIQEFVRARFEMKSMLSRVLGGIVHLVITDCVYKEIKELQDRLLPGTFEMASSYAREPCCHDEIIGAQDCLKRKIGKKNRKKYFIGTQDGELRRHLRHIPSVPLMYFIKGLLSLEEPSAITNVKSERKEEIKSKDKSLKPLLT